MDWLPQFKAAFESIVATQVTPHLPPPPASLADLPIVEVDATPGTPTSDSFAVLLSGDGGWAGIDKQVAQLLADRGVPTAGRRLTALLLDRAYAAGAVDGH